MPPKKKGSSSATRKKGKNTPRKTAGRGKIHGPTAGEKALAPDPGKPVGVELHASVRTLEIPFHRRSEASHHGAMWDPVRKVHFLPGTEVPNALLPFRPPPFSWERRVEGEANGEVDLPLPGDGVTRPRAHQEEGKKGILAARAAGYPGFLLADEVGLGKTITAWSSALAMEEVKTVLIIAPLSVIPGWRWTLRALGTQGKRVVALNWERMDRAFTLSAEARAAVRSKKGLARRGSAIPFDLVIFDECHRAKNPAAVRSKLAARIQQAASFSLWLSATAGQNPLELSYLAPLLAKATGASVRDLKDFEGWCRAQGIGVRRGAYGKWEWDGTEEDLAVMRRLLFEGRTPAGIRRVPGEIAGWPEINRILFPVGMAGEERERYETAWEEFRDALESGSRAGSRGEAGPMGRAGGHGGGGRGGNPSQRDGAHHLVAQLRFRQKASLLRIPGTVELVHDLLDNPRQVAVSVAFHDTLDALREALEAKGVGVASCHGKQDAVTREAERIRFQGGGAQVMLFTMEEGISLHQGERNDVPRAQIVHDLRWSGIQMAQIEGRCHRNGKFAQVFWAYAEDTVEERIATIVASRVRSTKEMLGDDTETLKAIEAELLKALRRPAA